jgi:3-oxoacyl-[acyl-carrier protein] reductase
MLLSGMAAIVTGGAKGIGRAIALKFAQEGCSLVIADVLVAEGLQVAEEVNKENVEGIFSQCDVSKANQVKTMVDKAIRKFGKIDILVNNAGIPPIPRSIIDVPEEDWDKLLAINLKGAFLCCKAVLPHMKERGCGNIINISSMGAIAPPSPDVRYSSAKAGLLGLTLDLALEFASNNIRVNAILPGPIFTEMWESLIPSGTKKEDFLAKAGKSIPMQKVGTPEDVAGVALFLASSLSGYVTGDRILVGGGAPLRSRY